MRIGLQELVVLVRDIANIGRQCLVQHPESHAQRSELEASDNNALLGAKASTPCQDIYDKRAEYRQDCRSGPHKQRILSRPPIQDSFRALDAEKWRYQAGDD